MDTNIFENFTELTAIGLAILFFVALGICAAKTRVENSKKRRRLSMFPYMKHPCISLHSVRENYLLKNGINRKCRKMLTMGNEQLDDDVNNLSKDDVNLKDPLAKNPDRRILQKALLENEIMRQRLIACLYKYDPYYEYY